MSEYASFPVDPDLSTVENCRINVRNNADIFVMVVGSRYGSIDVDSQKSITNIEFVEAVARGVPAYVFVSKEVLAHMQVWKANPGADFTDVVDTTRIFEFIDSFRGRGETWTFEFGSATDITSVLRQQFSFIAREGLELRRRTRGHDRLVDDLASKPLMIAIQREEHWEIRLFAAALKAQLDRLDPLRDEISYGFSSGEATFVDILDLRDWALDRTHEIKQLVDTANSIINEYIPAVLQGAHESGDPAELVRVARRLAQIWEDNARWVLRCRSVRVDDRAKGVVKALSELNSQILDELWEFGQTMINRIDEAIASAPSDGTVHVDLVLTMTVEESDELADELSNLEQSLFD